MAIDFNADQNRLGLAMLAAAGPSARPMSFGQRMFMGMGQHDQYLREKEAQEMLRKRQATQELLIAAQMQEMQAQAEQRRAQTAALERERALQEQFRSRIPSPLGQANQQAYAASGAPLGTVKAAEQQPQVDPNEQLMFEAMRLGQMTPLQYMTARQKDDTPMVLGEGGRLVTRGGRVLAENPKAPKEDADAAFLAQVWGKDTPEYFAAMRDLARKKTTHAPAATAISYGSPVPFQLPGGGIGYVQPPNRPGAQPQVMTAPDGTPMQKPPEPEKPLTEGQAKAMTFSSRMLAADKTLATLSRKGTDTSIPGSRADYGVGAVVNMFSPPEQQMLDQAKRDFINATLRRESGAVISPAEFENGDKQYFPQIGDSRLVKEQKARNRRIAIEGIRADVPKAMQSEVERISNGGVTDDDPLGLRGGR